jgi:hypothetical protein
MSQTRQEVQKNSGLILKVWFFLHFSSTQICNVLSFNVLSFKDVAFYLEYFRTTLINVLTIRLFYLANA